MTKTSQRMKKGKRPRAAKKAPRLELVSMSLSTNALRFESAPAGWGRGGDAPGALLAPVRARV